MFCSKCGKKLPDDSKFCPACGGSVSDNGSEKGKKRGPRRQLTKVQAIVYSVIAAALLFLIYLVRSSSDTQKMKLGWELILAPFALIFGLALVGGLVRWLALRFIKEPGWLGGFLDKYLTAGRVFGLLLLASIFLVWPSFYARLEKETFPQNAGALAGAFFDDSILPSPQWLDFEDTDGKTYRAWVYPGRVNLFVPWVVEPAAVAKMANPYGGGIINQIPRFGFYTIEVKKGDTVKAVNELAKNELVLYAGPDFVLEETNEVDLSGTGKRNAKDLIAALISSPDPNAKIVMAQLDNFVVLRPEDKRKVNLKNYDTFNSPESHGNKVNAAIQEVLGQTPITQVHIGGLPCERMNVTEGGEKISLCSSASNTLRGLAAVEAGAQINNQKILVNLSYGPIIETQDVDDFSNVENLEKNIWATKTWTRVEEMYFNFMATSEWAKKKNIILNLASGNGARLVNERGEFIESKGINVTDGIKYLHDHYPAIKDSIHFCAAFNANDGNIASYSNFGTGAIYSKLLASSPDGTSFSAPLCTAAMYRAWKQFFDQNSDVISATVRAAAKQSAEYYLQEKFEMAAPAANDQKDAKAPAAEKTPAVKPPATAKAPAGGAQAAANNNKAPAAPAAPAVNPAPAANNNAAACPSGLQVCGRGCVPANARCCDGNGVNSYCLQPSTACGQGNCYTCPAGQVFCGMFCQAAGQQCCLGGCPGRPAAAIPPIANKPADNNAGGEEVEISATIDSTKCEIVKQSTFYVERATQVPITEYTYRVTASGKARGPVGIMFMIGVDSVADAYFNSETHLLDMSAWTGHKSTRSTLMGYISRAENEPQESSWTFDGGEYSIYDDPDRNPLVNEPFRLYANLCIQGVNPCYHIVGPQTVCPK